MNTVTPKGVGQNDYQDDRLGRPADMIDSDGLAPPSLEASFNANASIDDGCSGKLAIDTLYENTVQTDVGNPRSQLQGPSDQAPPLDEKVSLYPQRKY